MKYNLCIVQLYSNPPTPLPQKKIIWQKFSMRNRKGSGKLNCTLIFPYACLWFYRDKLLLNNDLNWNQYWFSWIVYSFVQVEWCFLTFCLISSYSNCLKNMHDNMQWKYQNGSKLLFDAFCRFSIALGQM